MACITFLAAEIGPEDWEVAGGGQGEGSFELKWSVAGREGGVNGLSSCCSTNLALFFCVTVWMVFFFNWIFCRTGDLMPYNSRVAARGSVGCKGSMMLFAFAF